MTESWDFHPLTFEFYQALTAVKTAGVAFPPGFKTYIRPPQLAQSVFLGFRSDIF